MDNNRWNHDFSLTQGSVLRLHCEMGHDASFSFKVINQENGALIKALHNIPIVEQVAISHAALQPAHYAFSHCPRSGEELLSLTDEILLKNLPGKVITLGNPTQATRFQKEMETDCDLYVHNLERRLDFIMGINSLGGPAYILAKGMEFEALFSEETLQDLVRLATTYLAEKLNRPIREPQFPDLSFYRLAEVLLALSGETFSSVNHCSKTIGHAGLKKRNQTLRQRLILVPTWTQQYLYLLCTGYPVELALCCALESKKRECFIER